MLFWNAICYGMQFFGNAFFSECNCLGIRFTTVVWKTIAIPAMKSLIGIAGFCKICNFFF